MRAEKRMSARPSGQSTSHSTEQCIERGLQCAPPPRTAQPKPWKTREVKQLMRIGSEPQDTAVAHQQPELFGWRDPLYCHDLVPDQVDEAAKHELPVRGFQEESMALGGAHCRRAVGQRQPGHAFGPQIDTPRPGKTAGAGDNKQVINEHLVTGLRERSKNRALARPAVAEHRPRVTRRVGKGPSVEGFGPRPAREDCRSRPQAWMHQVGLSQRGGRLHTDAPPAAVKGEVRSGGAKCCPILANVYALRREVKSNVRLNGQQRPSGRAPYRERAIIDPLDRKAVRAPLWEVSTG